MQYTSLAPMLMEHPQKIVILIYIVIPDGGIRPIEAMKIIGSAIYKEQKKPIDILVGRASEFHQRKLLPTIERTVARDGVKLYG